MLRTLYEKVAPAHSALILVDVLNDFCAEGGAMHREGCNLSMVKDMMPRLERLLAAAREVGTCCIWIQCAYNTPANHYLSEVWLEHCDRRRKGAYIAFPVCQPGEWNSAFYQIAPRPDEVIVTKHRYGAFEGTDLDLILRSCGIRSVVMTGVATNVCVETTSRQAFMRDYYVVMAADCCATYSQAAHDATLDNIDRFFGQVVSSDEIMTCWAQARAHGHQRRREAAPAA
ncbi:MAG: isochorismatase family cysteine hydrolase [Xanthobacteraceae bacterium]